MKDEQYYPESEILRESHIAASIVDKFKASGYTFAIITNPGDRITFHKGNPGAQPAGHTYPKYILLNDTALIPELMDSMSKGHDYSKIRPAYNADPDPEKF